MLFHVDWIFQAILIASTLRWAWIHHMLDIGYNHLAPPLAVRLLKRVDSIRPLDKNSLSYLVHVVFEVYLVLVT